MSNAFGTGDTISLSWTSYNISDISLTLDIQNNTIQLTDSAISADLGEWNFVVPDAMFGSGLVKAVRNGVVLDSIAVTISDTKAPVVVRQQNRVYLPQLLMSAEAAKSAFEKIKDSMKTSPSENKGAIVIATVKGDIKKKRKNIVIPADIKCEPNRREILVILGRTTTSKSSEILISELLIVFRVSPFFK